MTALTSQQQEMCLRHGAHPDPPPSRSKAGVARDLRVGWPLNGLRHPASGDTNGWYLWVGEELESDADFFVPLHVEHLAEWRAEVLDYLALPPGWRFLLAPGHEDVWFDENLLEPRQ